ncbi:MAG: helicase-exonuclease AddAB subunit AddA, partial [Eubacteriaceae bacterium]|nr:helicase-exonuclease AddAB subunit AddA [Eubacteriaceae bacterium]
LVVEDKVPVEDLLVLTFTRAAAGEMKERLNRALVGAFEAPGADAKWLLAQIQKLPAADISTIHAFCGHLVREYFQEVGVDPQFKMGEETQLAILKREALEDVFEEAYVTIPEAGDNAFSRLVEMFSGNRDDEGLKKLVLQCDRFLSTLADPETWSAGAVEQLKMDAKAFESSAWGLSLKQGARRDLEAAVQLITKARQIADNNEDFIKTADQLAQDMQGVAQALKMLDSGYPDFCDTLLAVDFPRYKGSRKDKETSDAIKDIRNEAKDIVQKLQEIVREPLAESLGEMAAMAKPMEDVLALTRAFQEAYRKKKEDKGLLDFPDTEKLALRILSRPDIARELQQQYQYIFIDEYQDTNEMQEAIIAQIRRPDNYFMVGDVKQSIYRFRLADPGIFLEKYKRFGSGESPDSQLVTLGKNFRSGQGVIDAVNDLFGRIMSPELGEVAYDNQARLYRGVAEGAPYTLAQVHIIETGKADGGEMEARLIAKHINAMVGQPMTVSKTNKTKRISYRDIGVLMRAVTGRGETYARILAEEGIPTYYEGGQTYYESIEITVILNTIRIIDNYRKDIPLLAVLLSPIGGFTPEEVAAVRTAGGQDYFYRCVENWIQNPAGDLQKRLRKFIDRLKDWRDQARLSSTEDFLWRLYLDTGYYIAVGSLPGGPQRQKNLRVLLKRAADYKAATQLGIFQFADYVDQMKKQDFDTSPPGILSENSDVVRIMTIHKSKGLEFPVVFIAGMGRRFNRGAQGRTGVLFHRTLGICPDSIHPELRMRAPTFAAVVTQKKIQMEELSEEMRLLYVAMTRAMEQIVMVGSVKDLEQAQKRWGVTPDLYHLKKAGCYLDWVMQATGGVCPKSFRITEHPLSGEAIPQTVSLTAVQESDITDEKRLEIKRRVHWRYPGDGDAIPGKLSVTAIAKLCQNKGQVQPPEVPERMTAPVFLKGQSGAIGAAELGTGIHTVMQGISMDKLRAAQCPEAVEAVVAAEGRRMVADQILL